MSGWWAQKKPAHGRVFGFRGSGGRIGLRGFAAQLVSALIATHASLRLGCELSERQGSPALPTRIGLHAGRIALAGLQVRETVFTNLMHDVPNTASRVQELNKHLRTWILATEPVVRHLDSRLLLRRIATFRLVGRPHPVTIYEIMGRKSTAPAGQFDLCDEYGRALRLFEAERWSEAREAFSKILSIEPDDGPSQFMLERCRQSPPNGPIIEMEEK